ncbi:MAG: hypothetical protein GEU78_01720 [Actinobacteria bacterium]|nr:hypothetical protein [Actinomycetota bacterium]
MNALSLFLLGAQLAVAALVGTCAGELIRRWVRWEEDLGGPERALVALGGGVAFAVACMVGNVVTGGAIFGLPGAVPALGAVTVYLGRSGLRVRLPRSARDRFALALAVVALGLLYVVPVLVAGSGVRTGDPPWHLGWTEQLLGGEAVPNGPAPEYGRNAYPWGWHAVLATLVRLVPASDPLIAHDSLHVVLVGAIPLAAACLARRVRRDAGWAAAASASVVGGFGWLAAREPAFDPSPRAARFGADLVVASPNSVYELMPPALPRELGLVLLGLTGLLVIRAAVEPERRSAAGAGVALGIVGLVSVPMFVSGLAWTVAAMVMAGRSVRKVLLPVAVAALATFGLWAGPVAANYFRYGGFVDITPSLGKEWPLVQSLSAWGILVPFAIAGLIATRRSGDVARRYVLAFATASAALLASSMLRGALDWNLAGNATVLHQGRTWPPAHLMGAALAGAGAMWAWDWVRRRSRLLAGLGATAVLVAGAASPVLAADAMGEILMDRRAGFIYSAPQYQRNGYLRAAALHLDPDDIVKAYDDAVAFGLFELSGARLSDFDHKRLGVNDLRIRYKDLALRWEARKPFCVTHELITMDRVTPRLEDYEVIEPALETRGLMLIRYPEPTC